MENLFKGFDFEVNVNLKKLCTFKIGGIGKIILYPKDEREVKQIVKICKKNKLEFFVLGNGSNVLFPDNFLDLVLISLKTINEIKIKKDFVYVGAGVNLFYLNNVLAKNNLSGLEFSYGIPASMGGFVKMNGGAFGHEVCEVVRYVKVLNNGHIYKKRHCHFGYRSSKIDGVILGCLIKLKKSCDVEKVMKDFLQQKIEKQPCQSFSAGSVFKRNLDVIPAKIIDKMGLKGVKIGEAEISQKHAGFIVNNGNATAEDVKKLIHLVREKTGFNFQLEIVDLTIKGKKYESDSSGGK